MGILVAIFLLYLILVLYTALTAGLYTYQVKNHCGDVINVYNDSRPSGLVNFSLKHEPVSAVNNHCDVTIETGYPQSAILFYFTDLTMPECYDGRMLIHVANTTKPFPDQAEMICGAGASGIINYTFTTQEAPLTFRFSWDNSSSTSVSESFTLFYNTFHEMGNCAGFQCTNGRCIDQSATCSGYDACGDNSDCPASDSSGGIVATDDNILIAAPAIGFFFCVLMGCRGRGRIRSSSSSSSSSSVRVQSSCDCLCGVLEAVSWPCRKVYAKRHRRSECVSKWGRATRNCPRQLPVACCVSLCKSNSNIVSTQQPATVSTISVEVQTQTAGAAETDSIPLPQICVMDNPPPYDAIEGHNSYGHGPRSLPSAPPMTEEYLDPPPAYDVVMENYNRYTWSKD